MDVLILGLAAVVVMAVGLLLLLVLDGLARVWVRRQRAAMARAFAEDLRRFYEEHRHE